METDDETGPSIRLRVNVWNKCLRSGGGGLIVGGLGTSFVSMHGSKLGVIKVYARGTLVGISVGETDVSALGQEDVMCYGKEPDEIWGGGAGVATIMSFWTMGGYDIGF